MESPAWLLGKIYVLAYLVFLWQKYWQSSKNMVGRGYLCAKVASVFSMEYMKMNWFFTEFHPVLGHLNLEETYLEIVGVIIYVFIAISAMNWCLCITDIRKFCLMLGNWILFWMIKLNVNFLFLIW